MFIIKKISYFLYLPCLILNKNNIFEFTKSKFGIFSIDIYRNDYWLLREFLIGTNQIRFINIKNIK